MIPFTHTNAQCWTTTNLEPFFPFSVLFAFPAQQTNPNSINRKLAIEMGGRGVLVKNDFWQMNFPHFGLNLVIFFGEEFTVKKIQKLSTISLTQKGTLLKMLFAHIKGGFYLQKQHVISVHFSKKNFTHIPCCFSYQNHMFIRVDLLISQVSAQKSFNYAFQLKRTKFQ